VSRVHLQPSEYGAFGERILRPSAPVRFETGAIVVTLAGSDHEFVHPVRAVLSKIVAGDRFSVAQLKHEFYELRLADFVDVFSSTNYVLGALEVGVPPQELMSAKLKGMSMASRFMDAGQRLRFVATFCRAIGRCGLVPAGGAA
jgi:hypothetical protein